MNIKLHIERLVLDGLPLSQRDGSVVQAVVETELTRLLSEGGLSRDLSSGGALASVRANSIHIEKESSPAAVGQHIAGSLGDALSRD